MIPATEVKQTEVEQTEVLWEQSAHVAAVFLQWQDVAYALEATHRSAIDVQSEWDE